MPQRKTRCTIPTPRAQISHVSQSLKAGPRTTCQTNTEFPGVTDPVQRLSDVMFLMHNKMCNGNTALLQKLEWVVHKYVTNDLSEDVMKEAWNSVGKGAPFSQFACPEFPGKTFHVDAADPAEAKAAKALMGCPNGVGVSYLLLQHEAAYGKRKVDYVNIFGDKSGAAGIAWHIVPA